LAPAGADTITEAAVRANVMAAIVANFMMLFRYSAGEAPQVVE
jgi:hypothetical protein